VIVLETDTEARSITSGCTPRSSNNATGPSTFRSGDHTVSGMARRYRELGRYAVTNLADMARCLDECPKHLNYPPNTQAILECCGEIQGVSTSASLFLSIGVTSVNTNSLNTTCFSFGFFGRKTYGRTTD
jgi:hypothetical protein